MLSHCRKALNVAAFGKVKTHPKRYEGRVTRRSFVTDQTKSVLLMDANGIVYKRNEKKMAALARFLAETGRYEFENLTHENISAVSHHLGQVSEDANRGIITSEQYYMTLLGSLPIQPVDYTGALNAIKGAEYNISLLPDIQEALTNLKKIHGVRFAVVTDSMATTPQKKDWMEKAGINTDLFDVIINSSDMGVCKPDPLMYKEAIDRLGVAAHQAAFLGHRASELNGAQSLGITTLVMNPDADLLENRGAPLARYDYFLPGWRHVINLPFWPKMNSEKKSL